MTTRKDLGSSPVSIKPSVINKQSKPRKHGAALRGKGEGAQRGDAYSRTASGRGPIFKNDTSPWRTRCLAKVCGFEVAHAGMGEGLPFQKNSSGGGSPESSKDVASDSRGGPEPGSTCARSSAVKQHALECVCVCMCVETKLHLIQGSRHNSFLFLFLLLFIH